MIYRIPRLRVDPANLRRYLRTGILGFLPSTPTVVSADWSSYNQTFSPTTTTWLRPQSVLQARFVKISAQIDF